MKMSDCEQELIDLKEAFDRQFDYADGLRKKIQHLVDFLGTVTVGEWLTETPLLEDHSFTFPDGDTWYVTGHEPEQEELT